MLDKTSSIICAFGLAAAAPRSPYRHLELCGIAFIILYNFTLYPLLRRDARCFFAHGGLLPCPAWGRFGMVCVDILLRVYYNKVVLLFDI